MPGLQACGRPRHGQRKFVPTEQVHYNFARRLCFIFHFEYSCMVAIIQNDGNSASRTNNMNAIHIFVASFLSSLSSLPQVPAPQLSRFHNLPKVFLFALVT